MEKCHTQAFIAGLSRRGSASPWFRPELRPAAGHWPSPGGTPASVTSGGRRAPGGLVLEPRFSPGVARSEAVHRPPPRPLPARRGAPGARRPHLAASCHLRPLGHSSVLPVPRPGRPRSGPSFALGQALPARSSRPDGTMAGLGPTPSRGGLHRADSASGLGCGANLAESLRRRGRGRKSDPDSPTPPVKIPGNRVTESPHETL